MGLESSRRLAFCLSRWAIFAARSKWIRISPVHSSLVYLSLLITMMEPLENTGYDLVRKVKTSRVLELRSYDFCDETSPWLVRNGEIRIWTSTLVKANRKDDFRKRRVKGGVIARSKSASSLRSKRDIPGMRIFVNYWPPVLDWEPSDWPSYTSTKPNQISKLHRKVLYRAKHDVRGEV